MEKFRRSLSNKSRKHCIQPFGLEVIRGVLFIEDTERETFPMFIDISPAFLLTPHSFHLERLAQLYRPSTHDVLSPMKYGPAAERLRVSQYQGKHDVCMVASFIRSKYLQTTTTMSLYGIIIL